MDNKNQKLFRILLVLLILILFNICLLEYISILKQLFILLLPVLFGFTFAFILHPFVKVLRNANYTFPYRNGKEKYSLIFVESGEMNCYFTKTKIFKKLTNGNILFIPKKTPYIATYTTDNSIVKILTFDIISEELPDGMNSVVYKSDVTFSDIYKTISGKNANSTIFLVSKIYELLHTMQKESIVIPNKYKKIIPALNEIQKFYFKNEKTSYYSDMCYMSESNFRKLFKEYTGKSLIEYRNLIRISQAHKMIKSGEYTVHEAAHLSGFNNMSFFYEVYKKHISIYS